MKKVLAVLLAALMAFTTLGMFAYAEPVVDDVFTLDMALDIAEGLKDGTGMIPTVLVFNPGSAKLGTVPMGQQYYITAGRNKGCYAIVDANFNVGNYVQLPYIKDAGDGMAANWLVQTAGIEGAGRTFANGSMFEIPPMITVDKDGNIVPKAQEDNYIVFYANLVPNESTPVIEKILNIFYKVIKVLFGEELAYKLAQMVLQFGIVIED